MHFGGCRPIEGCVAAWPGAGASLAMNLSARGSCFKSSLVLRPPRSPWAGLWLLTAWTAATSVFAAEPRVDRSPGSPDFPGSPSPGGVRPRTCTINCPRNRRFGSRRVPVRHRGLIEVDDRVTYQSLLGLGSSLEHSTCYTTCSRQGGGSA